MKSVPIFYDIILLLGWSRDLRNSIPTSKDLWSPSYIVLENGHRLRFKHSHIWFIILRSFVDNQMPLQTISPQKIAFLKFLILCPHSGTNGKEVLKRDVKKEWCYVNLLHHNSPHIINFLFYDLTISKFSGCCCLPFLHMHTCKTSMTFIF